MSKTVAIVGGGAAGFFAAANIAEHYPDLKILIFESSKKILAKVEISGGGRCNVTHGCFDSGKLVEAYPRGRNELRGPFSHFSPQETIKWFSERGITLKTEADGRMFPESDSSQTIIDCLKQAVNFPNVNLLTNKAVKSVSLSGKRFDLHLSDNQLETVDYLLLATGSSKSGHALAASLGHHITACAPSLFTFKCEDSRLSGLAGVSFNNASLSLEAVPGKFFKQQGPMLITHWGLSGPAILKLSAFAARELATCSYKASLLINWLSLDQNIVREELNHLKKSSAAKQIGANPAFNLTRRFWESILAYCEIPLKLHFFELPTQQINKLVDCLTRSQIEVIGKGEFKEEFVTCGGVDLKEVNFKSFESKKVANLFFAGEILDIDGITGGFNFQAAWTGGWLASQAIIKKHSCL